MTLGTALGLALSRYDAALAAQRRAIAECDAALKEVRRRAVLEKELDRIYITTFFTWSFQILSVFCRDIFFLFIFSEQIQYGKISLFKNQTVLL